MDVSYAKFILSNLWNLYGESIITNKNSLLNNELVLKEFFFIILGGYGISYETNLSAFNLLEKKGYMNIKLYDNKSQKDVLLRKLENELSQPQFEPKTLSGKLRKYRFIKSKSHNFINAAYWLFDECKWKILVHLHSQSHSEQRDWLCKCPGIGMKSSSWLLRNIDINSDFAVFDIHILRFLKKIGFVIPENLNKKNYLNLENDFRKICIEVSIPLGKMDYLLWELSRNGYLKYIDEMERYN